MGTDIHYNFQKKEIVDGKEVWVTLDLDTSSELVTTETGWELKKKDFYIGRHYQLFAVLADVRNGFGFAGIKTGDWVEPIAYPRGIPEDYPKREYNEELDDWYNDLGDHSFSWLLGSEMLEWWKNPPTVTKIGVLTKEDFESWDGRSTYDGAYYGDIMGSDIHIFEVISPEEILSIKNSKSEGYVQATHIRTSWKVSLRDELSYFFDGMIKPLVDEYGEIRFVFGFDS